LRNPKFAYDKKLYCPRLFPNAKEEPENEIAWRKSQRSDRIKVAMVCPEELKAQYPEVLFEKNCPSVWVTKFNESLQKNELKMEMTGLKKVKNLMIHLHGGGWVWGAASHGANYITRFGILTSLKLA
jgi:hypothetical protein